MKIKQIKIHNFGKFHNREYSFSEGLNVVYGENESGKSTLHTFLLAMLFGMEKARGRGAKKDAYTQYEPWNSASFYSGQMEFEVGEKNFSLERNFYHKEKQTGLFNIEDGEQLLEEHGDLQMLLGGMTKEVYENTHCISQTGAVPGKELAAYVQNCMANAASTGDGELQVNQALMQLSKKKNQTAKLLKEETAKREHLLDKLQIEKEILEEDIQRQKTNDNEDEKNPMEQVEQKQGRGLKKAYLWLLVVGCFLTAGYFIISTWMNVPLQTAAVTGCLIVFLTLAGSILLYRMESQRASTYAESEKGTYNRHKMELKEKQTRLFNVLEAQNELKSPTERELELQQYLTAYELAGKTIQTLTGEIYEDFGDRINGRTSQILSELTNGRYDRVEINDKLEVAVYSQNRVSTPNQLSTGTLEQIYFALRISLGEILSRDEEMPFLLDETFSSYDEKRIREVLQWLSRQKRQVILFTCQKREMEYLQELHIPFHKIELEGN